MTTKQLMLLNLSQALILGIIDWYEYFQLLKEHNLCDD